MVGFLGACLVFTFDRAAHRDFWAAMWWAFLRLTDTGYLGEDRGVFDRVVSTLLTFTGTIVFLGAVVAILTTSFDRALRTLSSGRSRVIDKGHVVVLATYSEVAVVAEELLSAHAKMQREGGRPGLVLLLPNIDASSVAALLKSIPAPLLRSSRIHCRQGDIYDLDALERVHWRTASSLIVLQPHEGGLARPESAVFKMLLGLSQQLQPGESAPRLVVASSDLAAQKRLHRLTWTTDYDVIPQEEFAGQLLAQVLDSPGLPDLYRQLLTDQDGDSLFLARPQSSDLVGQTLRAAILAVEGATPIGVLRERQGRRTVSLAVLDEVIQATDSLVLIAPVPTWTSRSLAEVEPAPLHWLKSSPLNRVLVCGSCPWWISLVHDLCQRGGPELHIHCLAEEFPEWSELPEQVSLEKVDCLEDTLLVYDFQSVGQVLLLGGPLPKTPGHADIETIACMHAILENPSYDQLKPRVICELFLEQNRTLLTSLNPSTEVITTARFLQHVVAQVGAKPALYEVYEDLLAVGGCCFRSFTLAETEQSLTWDEALTWGLQMGLVPLGVFLSAPQEGWARGVHLHPPSTQPLLLTGHETLLVLQREDRPRRMNSSPGS